MKRGNKVRNCCAVLLLLICCAFPARAAEKLSIFFPEDRRAYQTNEAIHVCVLRQSEEALKAGELALTLAGAHGSRLRFVFPLDAANAGKVRTEHYYLNGWLLRPGQYQLTATVDGQKAEETLDVYSHIRKSSFVTNHWGSRASADQQEIMGEDSLGFNLLQGPGYGDHSIRGGVTWMRSCSLGGGHQLNLRLECDWSDPYSIIPGVGGASSKVALRHRRMPNVAGIHLYDEPGLTWHRHPDWRDDPNLQPDVLRETGKMTPHDVPAQRRSYLGAFGEEMKQYYLIDPDDPGDFTRWQHWGRWKLAFMPAAWRLARWSVEWVNPEFLTLTQSQYGWRAYADGYYFNVARSLPIISGHGGYDDVVPGYYAPSLYYEMGRARQFSRDAWYLPGWYHNLTPDRFRMEQYLTFMMGVQGLATPPPLHMQMPSTVWAAAGVVESNHLLLKLGPIFNTLKSGSPSEVGFLWSLSNNLAAQARDMTENYEGGGHHSSLVYVYLAGKLLKIPFYPVVEEDVLDGSLSRRHKVLIISGVSYLDPRVVARLESWIRNGGMVLLTGDATVSIKGAVKLGSKAEHKFAHQFAAVLEQRDMEALNSLRSMSIEFESARPLAAELASHLQRAGVRPAFMSEAAEVTGSRHARGDIEYIFATNATYDAVYERTGHFGRNLIRPVEAKIALPDDGRPVYDAIYGGKAPFTKQGRTVAGTFRFGPGQMRVFARTSDPIGSVQALTPVIVSDLTQERLPLHVELGAVLRDTEGKVLAGSAPLEVRVVDPLLRERYRLYRATDSGVLRVKLPLAANDAAGKWMVTVRDLLAGTTDTTVFTWRAAADCGATAGAARRSIIYGRDWDHIYRFFRIFRHVTIVKGKGDYDAHAQRLADALRPWQVHCRIVDAEEVNKPRPITEAEAATWSSVHGHTGRGAVRPGVANKPEFVGFDIQQPVILMGTPEDNPLIKHLAQSGRGAPAVLPYQPERGRFPGTGRSMVGWTRDQINVGYEAVTLLAYDAEGMSEAVGTLYEICAGLKPLTPRQLPSANEIVPATETKQKLKTPEIAWSDRLPDGATALEALPIGMLVLTNDGTLTLLGKPGKPVWAKTFDGGEFWSVSVSDDGGLIVLNTMHEAILLDGRGKQLAALDYRKNKFGRGVSAVAASPDGKRAAVSGMNGELALYDATGKAIWKRSTLEPKMFGEYAQAMAEWEKGAAERNAKIQAFREAMAAWKAADAKWRKTPAQERPKERPQRPERPQIAPRPQEPNPTVYYELAFTGDGKTVLGLTDKQVDAFDASTGKPLTSIGGYHVVGGTRFHPSSLRHMGPDVLLIDSNRTVRRFSAAERKVDVQLQFRFGRTAFAVPAGQGLLVGTESTSKPGTDYAVRLIAGITPEAAAEPAWKHAVFRRVPKTAAASGDRIAVGFWGGLVQVLDRNGKLIVERQFDQDIARLAWTGDGELVAGLADGRLFGLSIK